MQLSGALSTINRVGGLPGLSRMEADVLALLCRWRVGRDGWRYGKRADVARDRRCHASTVSAVLASLEAKGFLRLARWKYGFCVILPETALAVTARVVMAALVKAKRDRLSLRAVRSQIGAVAVRVWHNCQCSPPATTLYDPPISKKEAVPLAASGVVGGGDPVADYLALCAQRVRKG